MKNTAQTYNHRLIALVLAMTATIFALLGSVSLESLPTALQLIGPFCLGISVFILSEAAMRAKYEESAGVQVAVKILSILVVLSLGVCTITAWKSLWLNPFEVTYGDRFVYQNVATAAGISSIILTFLLSALQKDTYWLVRIKDLQLDERQVRQRQEVFEKSYKVSTVLLLVAVWLFTGNGSDLPTILAKNGGSVPGHLYWPAACVLTATVAMPMIIAAWHRTAAKSSKK